MPELLQEPTATEINELYRTRLGQPLSGADIRSLAEAEGVTPRTVQRWVTEAGEQRNAIPSRLDGKPFDEWPEVYQERAQRAIDIARGAVTDNESGGRIERFEERFSTLEDAQRWLRAAAEDDIDPWLSDVWERLTIEKGPDGWRVVVEYDRAKYAPALIVAA